MSVEFVKDVSNFERRRTQWHRRETQNMGIDARENLKEKRRERQRKEGSQYMVV